MCQVRWQQSTKSSSWLKKMKSKTRKERKRMEKKNESVQSVTQKKKKKGIWEKMCKNGHRTCNTVTVIAAQEGVYEEAFSPKRGRAVVASVKTRMQIRKKSARTPAMRNGNAFLWTTMKVKQVGNERGEKDDKLKLREPRERGDSVCTPIIESDECSNDETSKVCSKVNLRSKAEKQHDQNGHREVSHHARPQWVSRLLLL